LSLAIVCSIIACDKFSQHLASRSFVPQQQNAVSAQTAAVTIRPTSPSRSTAVNNPASPRV
jgi:hypothetical protein